MLKLGIDDAGRGPVIGPMALAGCLTDSSVEDYFRTLGVKDSKQLSAEKREAILSDIKQKAIAFEIVLTSPEEITSRNKAGINLNDLEAIKAAEIINRINKNLDKVDVYVDCPSTNPSAWKAYLEKHINNKENLILHVEHKADINHISCSAASILAKTARDAEIEKIKENLGVDFGSGYPSDPLTMKFLQENADALKSKGIFRETWSTWKSASKIKEQKNLFDF